MSATPEVATKLVPPHRSKVLAALAIMLVAALPARAGTNDGTLDVPTLRVRLKDTPAIGLITKVRLKGEIEDLMGDLAAFHAGRASQSLDALHERYRTLVVRVVGMLAHGDAALAHDLDASTDRLWATLTDPGQFAALARS
jgi:hypothetical protein